MAVRWKGGWSGSGSPGTSLITYYNGDSVLYLKPITLFSLRTDDYEMNKDYLQSKKFELGKCP